MLILYQSGEYEFKEYGSKIRGISKYGERPILINIDPYELINSLKTSWWREGRNKDVIMDKFLNYIHGSILPTVGKGGKVICFFHKEYDLSDKRLPNLLDKLFERIF